MSVVTSVSGNQYQVSNLTAKTASRALGYASLTCKLFNKEYDHVFSDPDKAFSTGYSHDVPMLTYAQILFGLSVSATLKEQLKFKITIDTSSSSYTSTHISAVRVLAPYDITLFMTGTSAFIAQIVKPAVDALRKYIDLLAIRQLQKSCVHTVVPRIANDSGYGNEQCGRFKVADQPMFSRIRSFMASLCMDDPDKYVVLMHSAVYYQIQNSVVGVQGFVPTTTTYVNPASRYMASINEKAFKEGLLNATICGLNVKHSDTAGYIRSGTSSPWWWIDPTGIIATPAMPKIPVPYTRGGNRDFGGVALSDITGGTTAPTDMNAIKYSYVGYRPLSSGTPPTSGATINTTATSYNAVPETSGWLIYRAFTNIAATPAGRTVMGFNPGDTIELSPADLNAASVLGTTNTSGLSSVCNVDPILRAATLEPWTTAVSCDQPFTVTEDAAAFAAGQTKTFYVPVNRLPIGPEIWNGSTLSTTNFSELQNIGLTTNPTTQMYVQIFSSGADAGNVLLTTAFNPDGVRVFSDGSGLSPAGYSGALKARQLGGGYPIYCFNRMTTHYVNPSSGKFPGADNTEVYNEEGGFRIMTSIQGLVGGSTVAGAQLQSQVIYRLSTLLGFGADPQGICKIIYNPQY